MYMCSMLNTTASRTALGPTQPPIQWVPGALSLVVKRPGREADHSPPSSAEVKVCVELYFHSPNTPSWRCVQLKHRDNFTFYTVMSPFYQHVVFYSVYTSSTTVKSVSCFPSHETPAWFSCDCSSRKLLFALKPIIVYVFIYGTNSETLSAPPHEN
jgi:hypothetical protein